MSQRQSSKRVRIDEAGLAKVQLRMAELEKPENPDKKRWSKEDLAHQAYVGLSTVQRFLQGTPRDRGVVISILQALGFDPLKFIAEHDLNERSITESKKLKPTIMIDWQQVCREMLQEQQEEQRFRRRATEQGFELNVYVPLGLVERKEQQRRSGILPMEQIHQLKQEVITRIYQHDEFLNDVIGQQTVGKNKHIAIVGEPGAGKTTLLDNIATYIQKNTEDLPICISLASLQGRTLKNYILEEWLPEALSLTYPDIDVETFHETSLQKRLRQGGVWLLLDGVDEMGETNTLEKIQNQLTDWLGKVRVVLTCRTNVWDAKSNNPLTGFDTYKTQNFSQTDVRRFIKQWFGFARKPQLGKVLREKLNQPQSDRIRQLVENPLRLALLCQVFNRDEQAELPETKAGLYELFVRYFYEWKPTLSSVDWTTQLELKEELHQALGRLSIAGLDSDARFRLPESLIKKELNDQLFKLAWELGWLNLVDREAKNDELVYAFFHPTFQEYFAALAIDDWDYFLPRDHNNNNPYPLKGKQYRVFEPQWKEVILLWFGQSKIQIEEKEKFILALLEFEDGCSNFYAYQAYFLAASITTEFIECTKSEEIIRQIIRWSLGYIEVESANNLKNLPPISQIDISNNVVVYSQTYRSSKDNNFCLTIKFREPIQTSAFYSLLQSNCTLLTDILVTLCQERENEIIYGDVAPILVEIVDKNSIAINAIVDLMKNPFSAFSDGLGAVYDQLENFGTSNPTVIKALIELIKFPIDNDISLAVVGLGKIAQGNACAATTLVEVIHKHQDKEIVCWVAQSLSKIQKNNILAITTLINIFKNPNVRGDIYSDAVEALEDMDNNLLVIEAMVEIIENINYDKILRENAAVILGKISKDQYHQNLALNTLINLLKEAVNACYHTSYTDLEILRLRILISSIKEIDKNNSLGIETICELIKTIQDEDKKIDLAESLNEINQGNPLALTTLHQLAKNAKNQEIRRRAAFTLCQNYDYQTVALNILIELLKNSNDEEFCQKIAYCLLQVCQTSQKVITDLIELINLDNKYKSAVKQAILYLRVYKIHDFKAINYLIKQLYISDGASMYEIFVKNRYLTQFIAKDEMTEVVKELKNILLNQSFKNYRQKFCACYDIFWYCAENISYPDFYRAWHNLSSSTHPEAPDNIPVGKSSITQNLNFTQLPSNLDSEISKDEELNKAVKLICIDINNEFSNPDMLAVYIYRQMVKQGCPKCSHESPTNMPLLSIYWDLDLGKLEKRVALLFYNSKNDRTLNPSFLSDIATFGGTIAIISDEHCHNVRLISPNDPNLIDTVLKWLRRKILED